MARHKLKDYLNDPSLLHSISEDEMIAWAAEVPYAGLVQRLLAQKLAIEASVSKLSDHANTMALLTNANPNHTIQSIEDFKQLILSGSQRNKVLQDEIRELDGVPGKGRNTEEAVGIKPELKDPVEHKEVVAEVKEIDDETGNMNEDPDTESTASMFNIRDRELEVEDDLEESAFSSWLETLKTLELSEAKDDTELELEEKELASDALAQLLVSQGHYERAKDMYQILMLKNPQKSSFFAAQIEKLNRL